MPRGGTWWDGTGPRPGSPESIEYGDAAADAIAYWLQLAYADTVRVLHVHQYDHRQVGPDRGDILVCNDDGRLVIEVHRTKRGKLGDPIDRCNSLMFARVEQLDAQLDVPGVLRAPLRRLAVVSADLSSAWWLPADPSRWTVAVDRYGEQVYRVPGPQLDADTRRIPLHPVPLTWRRPILPDPAVTYDPTKKRPRP